jgi:hypothetical protein
MTTGMTVGGVGCGGCENEMKTCDVLNCPVGVSIVPGMKNASLLLLTMMTAEAPVSHYKMFGENN